MGPLNSANQPKYQTRSILPSVDWSTFFKAVNDCFNLHLQTYGPPGEKKPIFTADYPKENNGNFTTGFDVISYSILQSVRAATDPSNKRRVPKGPTLRESRPHPTKERYSLVTFGWWEMMVPRFTITSLSRDRADEVTMWFHKMMMRYIFDLSFFKNHGVQYMTFKERGPDTFSKAYGQELYSRTLDYNVRLELLVPYEVKDLESINIQIGDDGPDVTNIDLDEQYTIPKP